MVITITNMDTVLSNWVYYRCIWDKTCFPTLKKKTRNYVIHYMEGEENKNDPTIKFLLENNKNTMNKKHS